MVRAQFHRSRDGFLRVEVSGHAGFAEAGEDIVCASVTSAVQLTANGITEVLHAPARVEVAEDTVSISLQDAQRDAMRFLEALYLHLEILSQQYTDYLTVTVLEV